MLKNLNPILGPELLATLRAMGHGDEIALVDGNYPALEHGRRLIRCDGLGLVPVLDAILSVLPVDDFVEQALFRSTVSQEKDKMYPIHHAMLATCARHEPQRTVTALVGDDFYDRVKQAHTIVATSEPQLYANMIIRKGVIRPESEAIA